MKSGGDRIEHGEPQNVLLHSASNFCLCCGVNQINQIRSVTAVTLEARPSGRTPLLSPCQLPLGLCPSCHGRESNLDRRDASTWLCTHLDTFCNLVLVYDVTQVQMRAQTDNLLQSLCLTLDCCESSPRLLLVPSVQPPSPGSKRRYTGKTSSDKYALTNLFTWLSCEGPSWSSGTSQLGRREVYNVEDSRRASCAPCTYCGQC